MSAESGSQGSEPVRRGYTVHGRVQGVGFRWWTQRQAKRAGIYGTVRNLADGTVEVMVAGSGDAIEAFEIALQKGPPLSVVERIEAVSCKLPARVTEFSIER